MTDKEKLQRIKNHLIEMETFLDGVSRTCMIGLASLLSVIVLLWVILWLL